VLAAGDVTHRRTPLRLGPGLDRLADVPEEVDQRYRGAGDDRRTKADQDAGLPAASVAAMATPVEELFRLTPEGLAKLAQYGEQFTDGGALRGFVRGDAGRFAGDLSFEAVSFGAEQALAMQTAAVALALRSAIADVQAAVEAVDEKVSDIQKKVRSREVGEVVGTYRFLQRVVDSTRQRGQLLEADWDQAAGARRDLEIALESLRAYVTETTSEIDAEDSLPKREAAIKRITNNKGAAGSLRLILVAEQALHLLEYLRLERVRTTAPEQVPSALADARHSLATQRELDASLVQSAIARIEAAKQVDPLEIHRVFSIPQLAKASTKAFDAFESFANASRADLPEFDRLVHRPEFAETRAEVKRHAVNARDGVIDGSKALGQVMARGARQASESVRERGRRKSD
jgi:hypothetical protein